jgi:hypothetical protein
MATNIIPDPNLGPLQLLAASAAAAAAGRSVHQTAASQQAPPQADATRYPRRLRRQARDRPSADVELDREPKRELDIDAARHLSRRQPRGVHSVPAGGVSQGTVELPPAAPLCAPELIPVVLPATWLDLSAAVRSAPSGLEVAKDAQGHDMVTPVGNDNGIKLIQVVFRSSRPASGEPCERALVAAAMFARPA